MAKLVHLFILLMGLVATSKSLAEITFQNSAGEKAYVFSENNIWKVKALSASPDGWPQLSLDQTFKTYSEAVHSLTQKKFSLIANETSEPQKNIELRGTSALVLWTAEHDWSWDWEIKYANWIQNEVDIDFFVKHNIQTDCADVMYSLRWIFSRINHLPAANRVSSQVWLTHRSMRDEWLKLPTSDEWSKDKRFLAALNYLTGLAYTHTLYSDSYPVEISAKALIPGAVNLLVREHSGHTMVIYRQYPATDGVRVYVFASTTPKAVRILSDHRIYPAVFKEKENGLLRMRWPQFTKDSVSLVAPDKMPYYSLAQYSGKDTDVNRVLNPNPNWKAEYEDTVKSLVSLLEQRKQAVLEGFKVCFPNKCAVNGSDYDTYSTPSRDERIKKAVAYFSDEISTRYEDYNKRAESEIIFELNGEGYTLSQIKFATTANLFSSNPNSSLERRWMLGYQNFAKGITEQLVENLKNRRQKIKNISELCQNQKCQPDSENFKKLNLTTENNMILSIGDLISNMADIYPTQKEQLNSLREHFFTDGLYNYSYSQWYDFVLHASNDPRSDSEFLEGHFDQKFDRFIYPTHFSLKSFKNKALALINRASSELLIYKLNNHHFEKIIFHNQDEKILFTDLDQDRAISCVLNDCAVFEVSTQKIIYSLPKNVIQNLKVISYQNQNLVLGLEAVDGDFNFYQKVKVYNLEKNEIVFEESDLKDYEVYISKEGSFLSISALKPDSTADQNKSFYRVIVLSTNPVQVMSTKDPIRVDRANRILFKNNQLFYKIANSLYLYNFLTQENTVVSGWLSTFDDQKVLSQVSQSAHYAFTEVSFDEDQFQFSKKSLGDFSKIEVTNQLLIKNGMLLHGNDSNDSMTLTALKDHFEIINHHESRVKIAEFENFDLYVLRNKNQSESQFLNKQMQPLSVFHDFTGNLIEDIYKKGLYYFTYSNERFEDGPYMTSDFNTPLGNVRFHVHPEGFLTFAGSEIYILK